MNVRGLGLAENFKLSSRLLIISKNLAETGSDVTISFNVVAKLEHFGQPRIGLSCCHQCYTN